MKQVGKRTSNKEELAKYKQDQIIQKNQAKEEQYYEKKKLLHKNDKIAAKMLKQKHADGETQVVKRQISQIEELTMKKELNALKKNEQLLNYQRVK